MDKLISKLAALGIPGLVLVGVMAFSGYAGAAAFTTALSILGGPFGMLAGMGVLALLVLLSKGLAEYGFERIYAGVIAELQRKGHSIQEIGWEIDSYPISNDLKTKLKQALHAHGPKPNNTIVDNKAWVEQHSVHLNPQNPDATFEYVRDHHPLRGCAQSPMPDLAGNETIGTLAELADAVTVACHVMWGFHTDIDNVSWAECNQTAIGNLAFIAVNHPDASVRHKHSQLLEAWRDYKSR